MKFRQATTWLLRLLLGLAASVSVPASALAHCDGLDGPVVRAAQAALDTRDIARVLIWVQPQDEAEIRDAFQQTLAVRALNPQAKALADRFFFETVVRVHRAGERAPYTGLKPAGRDLGPAIPAADKALETGSVQPVVKLLEDVMRERLRAHFRETVGHKAFKTDDLTAGREYVKAYVEFVHFVERLYEAAATRAHGHFDETISAPGPSGSGAVARKRFE